MYWVCTTESDESLGLEENVFLIRNLRALDEAIIHGMGRKLGDPKSKHTSIQIHTSIHTHTYIHMTGLGDPKPSLGLGPQAWARVPKPRLGVHKPRLGSPSLGLGTPSLGLGGLGSPRFPKPRLGVAQL